METGDRVGQTSPPERTKPVRNGQSRTWKGHLEATAVSDMGLQIQSSLLGNLVPHVLSGEGEAMLFNTRRIEGANGVLHPFPQPMGKQLVAWPSSLDSDESTTLLKIRLDSIKVHLGFRRKRLARQDNLSNQGTKRHSISPQKATHGLAP